jgi:hypothetical protein
MPGFRVVLYREGEERGAGWGAQLEDWLVVVWVETSPFSWCECGIFDPELEFPISAN